ncbi:uncharacterized protein G2W53_007942 [Senna tora]|uniref:Uncharacterized protein n=1 Tax=Senna tora TaxID=362788 RepID=A0A835CGD2_9FABA|nr:uncharacterized protein G2W53_007942 [Senna tora]
MATMTRSSMDKAEFKRLGSLEGVTLKILAKRMKDLNAIGDWKGFNRVTALAIYAHWRGSPKCGGEAPRNILMVDAEPANFEPTREWSHPYLPQPWVHESPVAQNLEELGYSHLGISRLRVVPTWSCGLFPCCNIRVAEVGLKTIVSVLKPL